MSFLNRCILLFPLPFVLLSGCSTINSQISGRTATEQYLTTAAIERAMDKVDWSRLKGSKVHIEIVGLQPPNTSTSAIRSSSA